MHATDVVHNPSNVDKKIFLLQFTPKDDPDKKLAPEDRYSLKEGKMWPKEVLLDSMHADQKEKLIAYIGVQDDLVKKRGQLGVVPVLMKLVDSDASPAWLPVALPCTQKDAQTALKMCGWEGVFWVSYFVSNFVSTCLQSTSRKSD
jgi:hypothetical protein